MIALDKHAVHDNGSPTSTTVVVTLSGVAAGDLLVCAVSAGNASSPTISVSDSLNGAWTPIGAVIRNATMNQCAQLFFFPKSAAGSPVITATLGTTEQFGAIVAAGFSGVVGVSPLDQNTGQQTSGTNPTSGSVTTTVDGELIFAAVSMGTDTPTQGAGLALIDSATTTLLFDEWATQTSKGAISGTWVDSTSQQYIALVATFKAVAAAPDDTDIQAQRFTQSTRMESQHQQELAESFGILPPRPPFAFEDDGQSMRWCDWRALLHEDPETQRALPPIPPVSIQEEFTEQIFVDWRARQYEDTDTHRSLPPTPPFAIQDEHQDEKNCSWSAIQFEDTDTHRSLPPTPPFAVQDEISERFTGLFTPFIEEDQPGKPIVAQAAPNIGLDDIEAHVKAYDRVSSYHEDDVFTVALPPPLAQQDEISERTFNWFSPAIEDDWTARPPVPPFAITEEVSEKWTSTAAPAFEDDGSTLPPVPPLPPASIQDDEQHSWRGWLSPAIEDDWTTTAPLPPLAFEDDLKTTSSSPTFFQIDASDFSGKPPLPAQAWDDEQSIQSNVAAGLSLLLFLDEFVNAPVSAGLGPTICALFARVILAMEAQIAEVAPAMESQSGQVRFAMEAIAPELAPAMEALSARMIPAMESQAARVVCC